MPRFLKRSKPQDEEPQGSVMVAETESTESAEESNATEEVFEVSSPDEVGQLEEPGETVESYANAPEEAVEANEPRASFVSPPAPAVSVAHNPNPNRMRDAFAGVVQALDGEVESLRGSLGQVESALNRAVEDEKEARARLNFRIDEAVRDQEKSAQEQKHSSEQERLRVDSCFKEAQQAAGQERERVDGRFEELKGAIDKVSADLTELDKKLVALKMEMQRQTETSQRVTTVLNSMAGAFSGNQGQASAAPDVELAPPTAAEPARPAAGEAAQPEVAVPDDDGAQIGDPAEVDDALARVFK